MAVLGMLLPAVLHSTHTETHDGILNLSRFSSCVMLIVYAAFLYFQLKSHRHLFDGIPSEVYIFFHLYFWVILLLKELIYYSCNTFWWHTKRIFMGFTMLKAVCLDKRWLTFYGNLISLIYRKAYAWTKCVEILRKSSMLNLLKDSCLNQMC